MAPLGSAGPASSGRQGQRKRQTRGEKTEGYRLTGEGPIRERTDGKRLTGEGPTGQRTGGRPGSGEGTPP